MRRRVLFTGLVGQGIAISLPVTGSNFAVYRLLPCTELPYKLEVSVPRPRVLQRRVHPIYVARVCYTFLFACTSYHFRPQVRVKELFCLKRSYDAAELEPYLSVFLGDENGGTKSLTELLLPYARLDEGFFVPIS